MKDPISKRSRGFGFITFSDPSSVDEALRIEDHLIDNRKVEAKRAVPRTEPTNSFREKNSEPDRFIEKTQNHLHGSYEDYGSDAGAMYHHDGPHSSNKIFVGGLHYETRDGPFRAYFEEFGKVSSAEVMFNRETHKSRGFGFVIFENSDSADRVLESSHHVINGKLVEVKRAVPRPQNTLSNGPSTIGGNCKASGKIPRRPLNTQPPKTASTPKKSLPLSSSIVSSPVIFSVNPMSNIQPKAQSTKSASYTGENSYAAALRFGASKTSLIDTSKLTPVQPTNVDMHSTGSVSSNVSQGAPTCQAWPDTPQTKDPSVDSWNEKGIEVSSAAWAIPFSANEWQDQSSNRSSISLVCKDVNNVGVSKLTTDFCNPEGVECGTLSSTDNFSNVLDSESLLCPAENFASAMLEPISQARHLQSSNFIQPSESRLDCFRFPRESMLKTEPALQDDSLNLYFASLSFEDIVSASRAVQSSSPIYQVDFPSTEFIDGFFGPFQNSLHRQETHEQVAPRAVPVPHQINCLPKAPLRTDPNCFSYGTQFPSFPAMPRPFSPQMGAFNQFQSYDVPEPMSFSARYASAHSQPYSHHFSQPFY